jgi:hypothetical protein
MGSGDGVVIAAIVIGVAALCVGLVAGFALGVLFVMEMTGRLPGYGLEITPTPRTPARELPGDQASS